MVDCPALQVRLIDQGYPFGDKVPKRVRVTRHVRTDFAWLLGKPPLEAAPGEEFPAWTNSYGAVSIVFPDGQRLGVKPAEFEVVEWHHLPYAIS